MEPSKVVQICLPRFASNRHGSELPARAPSVPKCTENAESAGASWATRVLISTSAADKIESLGWQSVHLSDDVLAKPSPVPGASRRQSAG
jgi:hypothetical protein